MKHARSYVRCVSLFILVTALFVHAPATPSEDPVASAAGCGCRSNPQVLQKVYERIASAGDLHQARRRALAPIRPARAALDRARWLAPWSDDIRDARDRLGEYEDRVREAHDPETVASAFADLVQLASAGRPGSFVVPGATVAADVDVGVNGLDEETNGDGCDYSTGEIIAIVIGFILGIIPGIILLIVLC